MNRSDLISRIKFYINMNDGQTDQDVTDARLIELLNDKYKEIVVRAQQEGIRENFLRIYQDTWSASETTMTLPSSVRQKDIIRIMDVTSGYPGALMDIGRHGSRSAIVWTSPSVMQWSPEGPASDTTLDFHYIASAEELLSDEQEPMLIPPEHHILLVWAVAIEFRVIADEGVPDGWAARFNEVEANWHKSLSRGKPWDSEPWVSPRDSDQTGEGNL